MQGQPSNAAVKDLLEILEVVIAWLNELPPDKGGGTEWKDRLRQMDELQKLLASLGIEAEVARPVRLASGIVSIKVGPNC